MSESKHDQAILALLKKPSSVEYDKTEKAITLRLSDCSEDDVNSLKQLIEEAQSNIPGVDYSLYFNAIVGSPLFKPANPRLAAFQVAKAYDIDPEALLKSFKAART